MHLWGREDVLRAASTALSTGRPVVFLGAAGSGRTSVLRAAATDQTVRWVSGHDRVDGVALAALAPLVAEAGLARAAPIEIYQQLPHHLAAARVTLVVDDVDLLDAGSTVLLTQLVRRRSPVLCSAPSEEALPHHLRDALVAADRMQIELPRLSVDDLAEMAAQRLGGELSVAALSRLDHASQGLPERVSEILDAGGRSMTRGAGGIELGPDLLTTRLRGRVAERMAPLSAAARLVVELVCAVPRLPEVAVSAPAADEAIAAGVLRHATGVGGTALVPVDDILRGAVLESLGSVHLRTRRAAAATLLESREDPACRDRRTELVLAEALECRGVAPRDTADVSAADLIPAMARALAEHRTSDAGELAAAHSRHTRTEQEDGATCGADLLLLRGRAHAASGDLDRACADLLAAEPSVVANDGPDGASGRLLGEIGAELGVVWAVRRQDAARAVMEVTRIVRRMPSGTAARLEADLVKWRMMAGQTVATSAGTPTDPTDPAGAVDRIAVAVVQAMTASMNGPVDDAATIVREGLAEIERSEVSPPHAADLLRLSDYLATAFGGRLSEADAIATTARDAAVRAAHPAAGMWEYAAAELAFHAGRVSHGPSLARRAVHHLAWQDFTGLMPTAKALLAAQEARHGRWAATDALLADLGPDACADVKVALHLARVDGVRRPAEASDLLSATGHRAIEESQALIGLLAIDEAFLLTVDRARRAEHAADLRAHADRSPLIAALARRAGAVLDEDVRALEASAAELGRMGFTARAAHAWETAAAWHRDRGAREAARRVEEQRSLLAIDITPWAREHSPTGLTDREGQIAALACSLRNREIADRLGLSVRTVENHLGRVFRKMGVTSREELAALTRPPTRGE